MRTIARALRLAACLAAVAVRADMHAEPVAGVFLMVEVIDYRCDDLTIWESAEGGPKIERYFDVFRFRVVEPANHSGQTWTILIRSVPGETSPSPPVKAGEKVEIRITTDALRQLLESASRLIAPSAWPQMDRRYVFSWRDHEKKLDGEPVATDNPVAAR
jgi:hypothetical protein